MPLVGSFVIHFCLDYPRDNDGVPVLEREGWEARRPPASVLFVRRRSGTNVD